MMRDSLRLEDSICNQGEDRCRKRARLATRSRRIIRGGGEEINNKINNIAMLVGAAISRTPDKVVATLVVDNKERQVHNHNSKTKVSWFLLRLPTNLSNNNSK